ncbi:fasciclin domain-containing protein [Fluviicola taffensis]|uniref:Beta-Ig-H3/fasciclin n=1 Tax=Fluviicola taffensis (strain DSM 16823 / NCIMB 13979 / RW262) TaxID=755732 RepID=F2IJP7_FLUTR|nr:beta-Ig-H3/fasciclin [Fluviicola taffensis DSM 16823]
MKKSILSITIAASMTAFGVSSCGGSEEKMNEETKTEESAEMPAEEPAEEESFVLVGGAKMVPSKDIVDNAAGSADHTTLVAAVKAAGLVETLKGEGPFTVFAPTNEAFNKLPKGTVESLLKAENKGKLTSVLTYHVVAGSLKAGDLKAGQTLKTVQGENLMVTEKDGKWYVNGAQITIADVVSSNGVTHVIDAVVLPKKM